MENQPSNRLQALSHYLAHAVKQISHSVVAVKCAPAVIFERSLLAHLSIELAPDNIRINAVAPRIVPTPLYGELNEAQLNALQNMQPLGRYGTPTDIADAVVYLANAWVTGVILPVNGGVDAGGDGSNRRREALTAAA